MMHKGFLVFICCFVSSAWALEAPDFVTHIPKEHFVGISSPMICLADARRAALNDVARQIVSTMGIQFDFSSERLCFGDPHSPKFRIAERLTTSGKGFVSDIEKNIVKFSWSIANGKYCCFVLVHYPDNLIEKMKKINRGAKVICKLEEILPNGVKVLLSEIYGVGVTFTEAQFIVSKKNFLAPLLSYYVWKVPSETKSSYVTALHEITVCNNSRRMDIPIDGLKRSIMDLLLGAEISVHGSLHGFDEYGRAVTSQFR